MSVVLFLTTYVILSNSISDHMTSRLLLTFCALIKWMQYLCPEYSEG